MQPEDPARLFRFGPGGGDVGDGLAQFMDDEDDEATDEDAAVLPIFEIIGIGLGSSIGVLLLVGVQSSQFCMNFLVIFFHFRSSGDIGAASSLILSRCTTA